MAMRMLRSIGAGTVPRCKVSRAQRLWSVEPKTLLKTPGTWFESVLRKTEPGTVTRGLLTGSLTGAAGDWSDRAGRHEGLVRIEKAARRAGRVFVQPVAQFVRH